MPFWVTPQAAAERCGQWWLCNYQCVAEGAVECPCANNPSASAQRAKAAQAEREAAKVAAASAEGEAKGLRLALVEAKRPFRRRWLG